LPTAGVGEQESTSERTEPPGIPVFTFAEELVLTLNDAKLAVSSLDGNYSGFTSGVDGRKGSIL